MQALPPESTLLQSLQQHACRAPEAAALLAPGRPVLTYRALAEQIEYTAGRLNTLGVARQDRVALVLPNGPEMATAFLGTTAAAACAPLNPSYRTAEFEYYLADLQACALIVPAGGESPALEAARRLRMSVLELAPALDRPAGTFELHGHAQSVRGRGGTTELEDKALLLHTSGTTARPKLVPLTQANLAASARHIVSALNLVPADRVLNIMPLFHVHGLMASLSASLTAGASLVAAPGFYAPRFFDWLAQFDPTWYTAVPSMHQAILARAVEQPQRCQSRTLRFIRSSSAALPPQVLAGLEKIFGVPVIEAYGMTEAAHQIASNPLPPRPRKPRSVGLAAGPDVAIMDCHAPSLLSTGTAGEIVVRGPNLTSGYDSNPEANGRAFSAGWFRTGDQGYLDQDGYLFITGRLKELINRGGEKVAPAEVEEALLDHPDVGQAVVFAMPDTRLGEDVAAAVVPRPGARVDAAELRRFVAQRLAEFKVPQRVLLLEDLPKGPTGKLQRVGLAAKLGLVDEAAGVQSAAVFAPPETDIEAILADLWSTVLRRERVSRHDRFLELGGDSILATQLVASVSMVFKLELSLLDFFDAPTVAAQGALIEHWLLNGPAEGPTVDLQRQSLPEQLGLVAAHGLSPAAYAPPENDIEALLAEVWQGLLHCGRVGRHDRFLDLGGDSIVIAQLVARVESAFGLAFELADFFDASTVAGQAALIERALLPVIKASDDTHG